MASQHVPPIDPAAGPSFVLEGRIVSMDAGDTLIASGHVCIQAATIRYVQDASAPLPPGFETAPVVDTGGTIYPGLIDLHNHLAYNALPLWTPPQKYTNRDQWSGTPQYHSAISGAMKVLGQTPDVVPAIVRYVECKCLLGGVTTSQGIGLASDPGSRKYYRGIVRNVEETNDAALPETTDSIADVEATQRDKFVERLQKSSCLLLHLAEGTDATARRHYLALQDPANGSWAVSDHLAGIHCTGLNASDFATYAQNGGTMVWSPLSNLLLYGATADVKAARDAGLRISIGCDWTSSGSRNLLGELKIARRVCAQMGGIFSDKQLVHMVTTVPAGIVRWQAQLGSLEPGKRADLIVLDGASADPYSALIDASEADLRLVVINGWPRAGLPQLMGAFALTGTEAWQVGDAPRQLYLKQDSEDPTVAALTLAAAQATLTQALHNLPQLAKDLEQQALAPQAMRTTAPGLVLELDNTEPTGSQLRPHLPYGRFATTGPSMLDAATPNVPLSQLLQPIELDPLTVADDPDGYNKALRAQPNLPDYAKP